MDNLPAVRLFLQIANTGSFSAAARLMGLATSSVTRQIGNLENELGVRLLHRTTRQVSLTEAGHLYYKRATSSIADYDDMNRAVSEMDGAPRGLLRITAPLIVGRAYLAPRLSEFYALYPEINIQLSLSDQIVDLVQEGFDGAVRSAVQLPDSTLMARHVQKVRRIIVASPDYLEKRGVPCQPQELQNHNCLVYYIHSANDVWGGNSRLWEFMGKEGPEDTLVPATFESNNGDALLEAAISGLGIAVLPNWHVAKYLGSGELVQLFNDTDYQFAQSDYNMYFVYPSSRHVSPKVRAFSDFLASSFDHL
ncbi:hypothetical protein A9Q83_05980 [Alphaproteobacteria bacterium 46_93_T64]|mgnify:CR=1 FL=1|nr:hypothetical protein A9Q83_05980 [Alphaproteobacteria bacterium 46_93_T64]